MIHQDRIVSIYENTIPPFAEAEMQRLYQSIFSPVAMFDTYDRLDDRICTYVAQRGAVPAAILLFRIEGGRIRVLNEVIRLDAAEIKRFTEAISNVFRRSAP